MVKKNIVTPDMSALLDFRIKSAMVNLNCVSIGTIETFDATNQTAEISINYKRQVGDEFKDYPLLLDCPVMNLTGGVSYLSMPIKTGDTCIVLFCDRDLDSWFTSGQIVQPKSKRIHSLSDSIAIVGIRSTLNFIENYKEDIASLIDQSGERLAQSGDTKYSYRTSNHAGWLILDGKTIGDTGSGADYEGPEHEELFDIIKEAYPNLGTEVFGSNVVFLPDERGRSSVAADDMGGSQAGILTTTYTPNRNELGGVIGEEAHQLTIAELAEHNHPISLRDSYGTSTNPSRGSVGTHSGSTGLTGGDVPHNTVQPGSIKYAFIKI